MLAASHSMYLHFVRMSTHFQGMTFVAGLSTALAVTGFAQAAIPGWFLEPITGRRFAAVAAILRQLVFQSLDALFELLQNADPVGYQTENQFNDRIFTLPGSRSNFFFGR